MKNNILKSVFGLAFIMLILTSCAEQRYYKHNNRHSREYYERRHETVPVGIEFRIHN
jgi:hypothetical protein